ncbi:hypothetical protein CPC16_001535 [Podila verticillata]|nr:hypothetical protein CPC16_001535 [Podila verticillata]
MSLPPSSIHSQSMSSPIPTSVLEPSPMTALYQSYHSQLENLKRLPVPYGDIYQALSSHETISLSSLGSRFRSAAEALSLWLETAEMALFGLEMDVEQEGASDKGDVGEIDVILHRFHPNIDMLLELKERIENRLVSGTIEDLMDTKLDVDDTGHNEGELYIPLTIQELCQTAEAVHSSWSSLNGMLDKVKGNLAGARVRGDLLSQIESILEEINDIDRGIDMFIAEKGRIASESSSRSSPAATVPPSPTLSTLSMTSSIHSTGLVAHSGDSQAKQRNMEALTQLDSRMALVLPRIEELGVQIDSLQSSETALGGSDTKRDLRGCHQQIVARWDELKSRREKLSEELKEDKWLAVFEQVAGQVESMMESMERAILHCQGLIDKIKNMVRDKVVPSAPIDRDHLFTIFKSFEAKHKYYAPAVNKMLGMLENGIDSRMTRNQDVIQKHRAMNQTWERLRGGLDRVEQELSGIENLLNILDGSIPSHQPTPLMQLPEKPLTTVTSPSIPGIPHAPSVAATYIPRPSSATGHRDRSISPAPTSEPQSRSGSAMGSYTRSRSASGTPSLSRTPSVRPTFSPVGSNSKLSTGIQSTRSTSPVPSARQLKVPPPVVTNQYVRMRTLSAPGPSPSSHNYMRETASAAAKVLNNGTRPRPFSPPMARSPSQQQQRPSSRNASGYKSGPEDEKPQRRRSSLSNSHFPGDGSPPPPMPTRSALKVTPQTRVYTKSGSYTYDRIDSAYGPGPGSATGSATSMGPEFAVMPSFEEPTSPSASSSSSSITSTMNNSRIPLPSQRRPSQSYQDDKKLSGVMEDKILIEDVTPYVPVRGDVLDEEFARIVNASPVQMEVRRLAEGKYYFGGRLEDQPAGTVTVGGKMVLCRLMEYNRLSFSGASGGSEDAQKVQEALVGTRPRSRSSTLAPVVTAGRTTRAASVGSVPVSTNTSRVGRKTRKVLVRVGGGWQDLDIFLLDHSFLANESAVIKAL